MKQEKVSIIIVNYNGKDYLKNCVHSILKNNYSHYEIIVVDNNSTDGSFEMMKKEFGNLDFVRVIQLDKNYGPALARNSGVEAAEGKIIGFLDNDTEVDPDWIATVIKYFEQDRKVGAIQCKLLFFNDRKKIDYAGEYLGSLGFLVHVASFQEEDRGQHDCLYEVLAAKSAGMFIRKDVFEKIGGFDEDYFIFTEETDLGWRACLSGYKVIFAYDSRVFHHFSSTNLIVSKNFNNYLVRFHGTKNYIMTLYKNLSFKNLILILPKHIFLWICLSGYLFFQGNFDSALNIIKAIFWNIKNYPKNRVKRKLIQKTRVVSDKELFKIVYKKIGILYYLKKFLASQKQLITTENQ
ncbi:MAG: glycosyltransferase family 2 protein [bacterium]